MPTRLSSILAIVSVAASAAAGAQSTIEDKVAYTRALIAQCQTAADTVVAASGAPGADYADAHAAIDRIPNRGCMPQWMFEAAHSAISRNEIRAVARAGQVERALSILAADRYVSRAPDLEEFAREISLIGRTHRGSALLGSIDTRAAVLSTVLCAWKLLREEAVSEAKTERRYAKELGGAPSPERMQRLQAQARDADEGTASALTSIKGTGSTPRGCELLDVQRSLQCWSSDRKHRAEAECADLVETGFLNAMYQAAPRLTRYK